ncbi:cyclin-dependent kinase, putative [Eimeria tenella]|uniref:Cyclin-dependent kinases regulatory subunit n=1 Tax=Eimeria tenella TaxID=5802 RepID=U6L0I7_EIMTE|nr:cyclin-dependent kinase, putative [Eimeria tenella]CDJ42094.1 cyclin-dependent kinase, putative [Eimeria tenella]|eukprot:XP_013232844.1 cyclin-dependent kinase, putative [Eimeria tenella]
MDAASQRSQPGRLLLSECPRSFLDSIPSPIAPAPLGSLGYVITKEHVDEMRRMEKLCEAKEEKLHREYKPVFLPVDEYLSKEINCELINVDIRSYPWKNTPFGDVYYSPRYNDDRYTYRHVLLTNGVRKEAERVAATVPGGLLTEEVFVHYLGIVLSSGWSHFMLFNKQFKELILRRPKEPDAPVTPEEVTRIRDGAPGPNDEVDSDSGDDEEQKAAIALIRKKEAEQQQRQLQDENKLHQAGFPDAESVAGNDCGSKEGTHEAAAKQQDSAAAEAPLRGALESAEAQEKENALLPQNSRETAAKSEKPPLVTCTGSNAARGDRSSQKGAAEESEMAQKPLHAAQSAAAAGPQGRRRRAAPTKAAAAAHSSSSGLAQQQKTNGKGLPDAAARARGRAALRRKEAAPPPRAAAAAAAGRRNPSEAGGPLAAARSAGTAAEESAPLPAAAAGRVAARHLGAPRAQPRAAAAARTAAAAAAAKADGRAQGRAEEKLLSAADAPGGKRRLEGGEVNKAKQRRV